MPDTKELMEALYRGRIEALDKSPDIPGGFYGGILRGELHYIRGEYLEAVRSFEDALKTAEMEGNRRRQLDAVHRLIFVCLKAGLRRKAGEYMGKGDALFRRVKNPEERSGFLISHAFAISQDIGFIESEKFSEELVKGALQELKEAEKGLKKGSPLHLRAAVVRGILLEQMGEWGEAESVLKGAERLAEKKGYIFIRGEILEERGNLHLRRGEEGEEGQFEEAMKAYLFLLGKI